MKMKEIGPRGGHEASLVPPPLGSANGKSRKGKLSEFRDEKQNLMWSTYKFPSHYIFKIQNLM